MTLLTNFITIRHNALYMNLFTENAEYRSTITKTSKITQLKKTATKKKQVPITKGCKRETLRF